MSFQLRLAIFAFLLSPALSAQVDFLTAQYSNDRTGANMDETVLTAGNVNPNQFGALFSLPVDGSVWAMPLVVTQFTLPDGSQHNLLIVSTMNNSVYAFDADNPAQTAPYWHVNLGTPLDSGDYFLGPFIGILATPAIDRSTNTIYLTAMISNNGDNGIYLFALDLSTGALKYNSPQRAVLPFPDGEQMTDATAWYQRAGILVSDNAVYVGYTYVSDDTLSIQHGFVQSFQADDLSVRLASWESSPTTPHGGVWQAGRGLAADALGNLYIVTADGEWDGASNFGNSAVQLSPRNLAVESYFTPSNWYSLYLTDTDLGANGMTLMPGYNLAFTGGKQGIVYLMHEMNLGGLQSALVPVQAFQGGHGCGVTQCGQNLSTAFWPNTINPTLFVWDKQDYLRAYPFDPVFQQFEVAKATVGPVLPNSTGGIVVTSNGNQGGTGVVWAYTSAESPQSAAVPGTLRAYDATDITKEIYNSDQNSARDATGSFVKFVSPVVADGRVYVANQSGSVRVYGLLCQQDQSANLAVHGDDHVKGHPQKFRVENTSDQAIAGPFSLVFSNLPAGVTVENAGGTTACAAPAGSPWLAVTGAPLWLQPHGSISVEVTFDEGQSKAGNGKFSPTVIAGSGGQ